MTGAPIPEGADTIIRQEDTDEGVEFVKIYTALNEYDNYCYEGEDFKEGTELLKRGKLITSSEVIALASIGFNKVKVYKKAIVGIINTGDEIQNPGTKLKSGKIYNSNGYLLKARLSELGFESILYNLICDEDEEIIKAIKYLEAEKAGYNILFWKVDIKPGSPMFAAFKEDKLYIGLSGTPVAAATTFELTCRDVLSKMYNTDSLCIKKRIGILMDNYTKLSNKRRFLRVYIDNENKVFINNVYQTPGQVHTMINSNAILEIPKMEELKKGEKVEVLI